MNRFWKVSNGDGTEVWYVFIETTRMPKKYKGDPMGVYWSKGKRYALQYAVIPESKAQLQLFEEFGLTPKDEYKEKRQRRKAKAP
ncbi:hypothetical protein QB910_000087 [Dabrowskivirus KKP3916]|uniref:Uncharacterized protein n=1 Tax=Alicyclobacillus phage KKP_3916 TaxID=3040651 RepID=A0AAT9V7P4_9CAUD|nr:hypothetical protein QB910_000087 [Alicyclobacillus phage KKP 3916]